MTRCYTSGALGRPKWSERPLTFIVLRRVKAPRPENFAAHLLQQSFAKWQVPDRHDFIDVMPLSYEKADAPPSLC